MTKFFKKFKKLRFWKFILTILGAKNFFWKIRLCHTQRHMGFEYHAKI